MVGLTDSQRQAILDAANGDTQKAALMENILRVENRGRSSVNNNIESNRKALGAFQITPPAWLQFGQGDWETNARDFNASANTASRMIDWIGRHYSPDPGVIAAYYNGGSRAAHHVMAGLEPPARETQNYVRIMRGLYAPQNPRITGTDQISP